MNSIFGIFPRVEGGLSILALDAIRSASKSWNLDDFKLTEIDGVYLGTAYNKVASVPRKSCRDSQRVIDNVAFIATGRLDNVSEISDLLCIPESERALLSDSDLLYRAYIRWGKECFPRLLGDWTLAAWHPIDRQLVLSRSHHGNLPLYYIINDNVIAFASSRHILKALRVTPLELDELYLAQQLISWPACISERTLHKPIKRLQPAHSLAVSETGFVIQRYWHPEFNEELYLPNRIEYVEGLRSIFDEAVRCRLRSDGPIAVSMSGGLDSSSVAVTAAKLLAESGQRLTAFTSVPYFDTQLYINKSFGDEFPFAKAIAEYAGNIDLHPLTSIAINPIMAIRRVLHQQQDLCHGASNLFWLQDIQQTAVKFGCSVLLTGAAGNGSISWAGDIFSQPLSFLLSHMTQRILTNTYINRAKKIISTVLPNSLFTAVKKRRMEHKLWYRSSAIHPDFAHRIRLLDQWLDDPFEQRQLTPREQISQIIMPGRSFAGAFATEMGAEYGLEVRDPTVDIRLIDFVYSVPDHIFIDPKSGINRWLIREAMKGRLPDKVRLNRKRGWQSADLVPRLRVCAGEVEIALDELAFGPAAEYVDVDYMRLVWKIIQTEDTNEALDKSITILTRGIFVGLFVNQFYE